MYLVSALIIGSLRTSVIFDSDWTVVLYNLIENSKALFEIVKFLNVLEMAMSIISKNNHYAWIIFIFTDDGHSQVRNVKKFYNFKLGFTVFNQ